MAHETTVEQLTLIGRDAARRVGIGYRTFLRYASDGRAPAGMKIGSLRRWSAAELDQWIAAGCPRVAEAQEVAS